MSRDQKIGLALGILLVGAVAAFFFRHETPDALALPELKSAAELDQQISVGPRAPYFEPRLPSPSVPPPTDARDALTHGQNDEPVPAPIALTPRPNTGGTQLASSSNVLPGNRTASQPDATTSPELIGATTTVARTHLVRRGDTLSSIAAQYLGSATRFEEIYEANRDRLRDANDLRIGQQLRIPTINGTGRVQSPLNNSSGSNSPSETNPPPFSATAPAPSSDSSTITPARGTELKFVPYPGNRTVPARTATPAESGSSAQSGRRLSQIPPDDVIIRR